MNALISKGSHSTGFHVGAVFSTQFYILFILIINPNDHTVLYMPYVHVEMGTYIIVAGTNELEKDRFLVLFVLTIRVRKSSCVEHEEWENPSSEALSGLSHSLLAWSGAARSGCGRINYLTSEENFLPKYAMNGPRCLFGQGPSWRSTPLDLGIERDFLVHVGLVGFCKAFCDCVILSTTVS